MNNFTIILSNLGQLNAGNNVSVEIEFPIEADELTAAYNQVSYNGNCDVITTDYDAPFEIGDYEQLTLLNDIANLDRDKYEGFLILANHMSIREAYNYVNHYNFHIFHGVEDLGDVARCVLEDDAEFRDCPDFVKRHFDFDAYGEELESGSEFYEDFKNKTLLEILN